MLHTRSGLIIGDVTAVNPLTAARTRNSQGTTGTDSESDSEDWEDTRSSRGSIDLGPGTHVTDATERWKRRKYAKLIESFKATFHTAAVETTGGLGKELRELLDKVAREALTNETGWDKGDLLTGMTQAIAVAIQIGNANLIHANQTRILRGPVAPIQHGSATRTSSRRRLRRRGAAPCSGTTCNTSASQAPPSIGPATEFSLLPSFSVAAAR